MKTSFIPAQIGLWLLVLRSASAQGTFVYDQQSFTNTLPPNIDVQVLPGTGQSFVPTLSSIGFVKLELGDGYPGNAQGATVYVNLHANAINGPVISSTDPIFMSDSFFGLATFLFSNPPSLTPGDTYYLEPFVQSGDAWYANTDMGLSYPQGALYIGGLAQHNAYFWFREGVVAPEPGSAALALLDAGVFICVSRKRISGGLRKVR